MCNPYVRLESLLTGIVYFAGTGLFVYLAGSGSVVAALCGGLLGVLGSMLASYLQLDLAGFSEWIERKKAKNDDVLGVAPVDLVDLESPPRLGKNLALLLLKGMSRLPMIPREDIQSHPLYQRSIITSTTCRRLHRATIRAEKEKEFRLKEDTAVNALLQLSLAPTKNEDKREVKTTSKVVCSMPTLKILACGDVNGSFDMLLKRVKTVHQKSGPFEFVVCVGEFFGPSAEQNEKIINGEIEFPIPVYVLGPCCPSTSRFYPDEPSEFSSNVTYLGKCGTLTTAAGFTIAYLSGIPASAASTECKAFEFNAETVDKLTGPALASTSFVGVDILLTSVWPSQVARHSTNQPSRQVAGSEEISRLATTLKPRYHFAGQGVHYERDPYRNHEILQGAAEHVTRFVSLSPVGNAQKEKWMYAFSTEPLKDMTRQQLVAQPPQSTEFPYKNILVKAYEKKRREEMEAASKGGAQYFYDMNAPMTKEEEREQQQRGGRKRTHSGGEGPTERKQPSAPCWFCLSNVDAEKYLIVSVGTHCYLAMPKGPLAEDHLMVLPIGHIQSLVAASSEVREEVEKYRDALTLFYDARGKSLVMFERNFKTGHLQVQMVGIPKESIRSLRSAFQNGAQAKGFELTALEKDQQVWDVVNEGCPYFCVEFPDSTRLFTRSMKNFPLHFGREVLAGKALLDCDEKVDWRACEMEKGKQAALVKKLAKEFKKFDFGGDSDGDSD